METEDVNIYQADVAQRYFFSTFKQIHINIFCFGAYRKVFGSKFVAIFFLFATLIETEADRLANPKGK